MTAKAVPEGYHTLTPFLTIRDAARAIEFYKQAFGATERGVNKGPDASDACRAGDRRLDHHAGDEFPEFGSLSPQSTGGTGMGLHIYIEDVDSAFDRAVKAGATVECQLLTCSGAIATASWRIPLATSGRLEPTNAMCRWKRWKRRRKRL